MTTKAKPTPGPWTVFNRVDVQAIPDGGALAYVSTAGGRGRSRHEAEANAEFIAEAGTVLHETGLTPKQLADQRGELIAACHSVRMSGVPGPDGSLLIPASTVGEIEAAIAKARA